VSFINQENAKQWLPGTAFKPRCCLPQVTTYETATLKKKVSYFPVNDIGDELFKNDTGNKLLPV
jgi:hypothetical protein